MSDILANLVGRLRLNELFKPENRWMLISAFVMLASFYLARIAHSFVAYTLNKNIRIEIADPIERGTSRRGRLNRDYDLITQRNIFDSQASKRAPQDVPKISTAEATKTRLNIKLIGTAVFSIPTLSTAIIQDVGQQKVNVLHIGDRIQDATLIKVERYRVHLKRGTGVEYLDANIENVGASPTLGQSSLLPAPEPTNSEATGEEGIEWTSETDAVVDGKFLESSLKDMSKILQEARMVPNMVNGQQRGFKVFAIKGGSIYEKIGLKNNDVLLEVNGRELKGLQDMDFLMGLQHAKSLKLNVERGGARKSFSYEIK